MTSYERTPAASALAGVVRVAPTAGMVGIVAALAFVEGGSVAGGDWLGYALIAAIVLAVALVARGARRSTRAALVGIAGLTALAAWTALSIAWSPLPAAARDEALLAAFYALALAVPALTLRGGADRLRALALLVLGLGAMAIVVPVAILAGADLSETFPRSGRLYWPVTYVNAQAALFLVGFWPAMMLAARRATPLALRAATLGAGTTFLAGWLLTQSRGAAIALAVSAVAVFALCPARLRLLVPTAITATITAAGFGSLTGAYLLPPGPTLEAATATAARAMLALAGIGLLAGLAYAAADRRLAVPRRAARAAGAVVLAGVVAALAAGAVVAAQRIDDPGAALGERWEQFKQEPSAVEGASHFANPGSNRYDFWRVAIDAFRSEPLVGVGAWGFLPEYLRHGESGETPSRSHSLPLDVLAETGLVGLLLLLAAVGAPLVAVARRLDRVPAAAAFGAAVYWLAHAAGDWTWTFPVDAVPFFLLLGIALAPDGRQARLGRRSGVIAGSAVAVAAVLAFAPPWLAARFTERALATEAAEPALADLDRAQRLDPLDVDALLWEAKIRGGYSIGPEGPAFAQPGAGLPALREAVERQPEWFATRYLLALASRDAGLEAAARREAAVARRLFPDDDATVRLFRETR